MKIYLVICFVFIANILGQASSDAASETLHKLHQECSKTSGIDEETMKKLEDAVEFPENNKVKVHTECVLKGIGIMDNEGKVDEKAAATILQHIVSDGKEKDIVKKCIVDKDDAGKAASLLAKCIFSEVHALRV